MLKRFLFTIISILALLVVGCSGEDSASDASKGITNPPDPLEPIEVIITDIPPDQLVGGGVSVDSVRLSGDQLTVALSHSGGCVADNYVCYMSPAAFLESLPVQTNLHIRNDSPPDPCDAIVIATVVFDLSPVGELFNETYGDSGSVRLNIYDWIDGVYTVKYSVLYTP